MHHGFDIPGPIIQIEQIFRETFSTVFENNCGNNTILIIKQSEPYKKFDTHKNKIDGEKKK